MRSVKENALSDKPQQPGGQHGIRSTEARKQPCNDDTERPTEDRRPGVVFHIPNEPAIELKAEDFDNIDERLWGSIVERCQAATEQIKLDVSNIPAWEPSHFWQLLIRVKASQFPYAVVLNGQAFDDPFDAVLFGMVGLDSLADHGRCRQHAITAAAVFHPECAEPAAAKINARLKELGAPTIPLPRLAKQIREFGKASPAVGNADGPEQAARRFIEHLREVAQTAAEQRVLRYHDGEFYAFGGVAWQRVADSKLEAWVVEFLQGVGTPELDARFVRDVTTHLKGLALLHCWDIPMPFKVVSEEPLNVDLAPFLVFTNGVLELDRAVKGDIQLIPHDPAFFTQVVLPYEYNPQAACPLWRETINDILPQEDADDNRQQVLQEFAGYCLLCDCRFQKFLIMLGPGGNGKSTIEHGLRAMLGDSNWEAIPLDVLGNEFRLMSLRGKLANFSGELSYLSRVNEGLLKRVVSGEPIDVNRKYKDPIKLKTAAKLIVNTNEVPSINDASQAIWDRIIMMLFTQRLRGAKTEDKTRPQRLEAELPGIFNWALAGLIRLLTENRFTDCSKCAAAADAHRRESDSVLEFLDECCAASSDTCTESRVMYELYRVFAASRGRKPVANNEFGKRLKSAHPEWSKRRLPEGERENVYTGVTLSIDAEPYVAKWRKEEDGGKLHITHSWHSK
jgi:P4 family phage/plasmid primase-like protien